MDHRVRPDRARAWAKYYGSSFHSVAIEKDGLALKALVGEN